MSKLITSSATRNVPVALLKDAEKYPVGHLTNKRWEKQQQQQNAQTDIGWFGQ